MYAGVVHGGTCFRDHKHPDIETDGFIQDASPTRKMVVEASAVLPDQLRDEPGRHGHGLSQLPFPLDQPPTPLGTPYPVLDVHPLLPAPHHLCQE